MKVLFLILLFTSMGCFAQSDTIAQKKVLRSAVNSYIEKKDYKNAAIGLTEILKICPNDVSARRDRAMMYLADKEYDYAIDDFTKLIDADVKNKDEVYFYRGLCKFVNGLPSCDDLLKAKVMGFKTEYSSFQGVCPELK